MNDFDDNREPSTIDDLHDRLVDRALRETLGNDLPPELSPRIMAAAVADRLTNVERRTVTAGRIRFRWRSLAVAATLLVGVTLLLLINDSQNRETAAGPAQRERVDGTRQVEQSRQSTPVTSSGSKDFESLADLIQSTVSAEHWADVNGDANRQLVIEQSQSVEEEAVVGSALPASSNGDGVHPSFTADVDLPYRQDSFAQVEQRTSAAPVAPVESAAETAPASLPSPYYLTDDVQYGARPAKSRWAFHDQRYDAESEIDSRVFRGFDFIDQKKTPEGTGPGNPGDQYTRIFENPFIVAEGGAAVSTFSIDVDTASYANVRQFLQQMNALPPPDAVRIEELINYFDYDYAGPPGSPAQPPAEPGADDAPAATADATTTPSAPGSAGGSTDDAPFAAHVEVAGCPWRPEHRLVRIGIKGREMEREMRPKSNLVFLVDVSGSMDQPNKLPLVVEGLEMLTRELGENDRVAIVVYASSEGLVLPSTPGNEQQTILDALGRLQAGGSTAGGAGIQLAYQIAEDNFIEGGTNRVILCTDGDFNVGVTSTAELERLCEQKAKDIRVFLSVLGFGRGNLNDAMMEAVSNRGNGNYAYVDNCTEARRVLVNEMTGTLVTIAKDVKIQVEFNPQKVAGYRLLGYENRMLRTEDFNDDKIDAGEIGAGHTVTALYEVVPAGKPVDVAPVDDLKYQQAQAVVEAPDMDESSNEILTLKMRYKQPEGDNSKKLEWPISDDGTAFAAASLDFQFATAVAGFGLMLRDSQYKGNLTYGAVLEVAQSALGEDKDGYRAEFVELVRKAKELRRE